MITVHCLEGRVVLTADGDTRELAAGHWLFLTGGVPHTITASERPGAPDGDVPLTAGPPEGPSESSQPPGLAVPEGLQLHGSLPPRHPGNRGHHRGPAGPPDGRDRGQRAAGGIRDLSGRSHLH